MTWESFNNGTTFYRKIAESKPPFKWNLASGIVKDRKGDKDSFFWSLSLNLNRCDMDESLLVAVGYCDTMLDAQNAVEGAVREMTDTLLKALGSAP